MTLRSCIFILTPGRIASDRRRMPSKPSSIDEVMKER